jgi:class 3 adenylate cyclase
VSTEHGFPTVASEAIVVVDLVESTNTSDLYGWYAVGQGLMHDLRNLIIEVGTPRGMACLKSTGDGYLFTFHNKSAAGRAVLGAIETCFLLADRIYERNREMPEEHSINLRFAVHFGEVSVLENDREGPDVSFAFRIEGVSNESLATALHLMPPEELPVQNYVLCSEAVNRILGQRSERWTLLSLGLLKLKGFDGYREIFRVQEYERTDMLLLTNPQYIEHPKRIVESFRAFAFRKSIGTLSLWVCLEEVGQGIRQLNNNRYLFACVRRAKPRYKNVFALCHGPMRFNPSAEPSWKLWLADEDGRERIWSCPDGGRFSPGWHLFIVRWNHNEDVLEMLIDGKSHIKATDYLQYWPKGRADHAHIGYWPLSGAHHCANTSLARLQIVQSCVDDKWIEVELQNRPTSHI